MTTTKRIAIPRWAAVVVWALVATSLTFAQATRLKSDETLVFYPSYLTWDREHERWSGEIHGNIHEPADGTTAELRLDALEAVLDLGTDLTPEEEEILRDRAREFLVDNERGKTIVVRIQSKSLVSEPSRANGSFVVKLTLEKGQAGDIVAYEAVIGEDDPRSFGGMLRLIAPEGVSVISDIDDTVKDTNVTDRSELLANTFLRPYRAIEGMAELYDAWEERGVAIHYLTGSPWQLYSALWGFLADHGFPGVEIQMRELRVKGRSGIQYFGSPENYKSERLREILGRFPERRFVLVGDSGEKDPEVYATIAREFPDQVDGIFIRAIREEHAERERYREMFSEIDDSDWIVFRDARALPRDLPAWVGTPDGKPSQSEVTAPAVPVSPRRP